MSSINYFDEKKYKHEKRTDISFGIGDDGKLAFTTLKGSETVADAIAQLESTIANFSANHVISDYKYRSAYAANRQHPYFQYSKKEEIETFRTHTRFRLNITNTIVLK